MSGSKGLTIRRTKVRFLVLVSLFGLPRMVLG